MYGDGWAHWLLCIVLLGLRTTARGALRYTTTGRRHIRSSGGLQVGYRLVVLGAQKVYRLASQTRHLDRPFRGFHLTTGSGSKEHLHISSCHSQL